MCPNFRILTRPLRVCASAVTVEVVMFNLYTPWVLSGCEIVTNPTLSICHFSGAGISFSHSNPEISKTSGQLRLCLFTGETWMQPYHTTKASPFSQHESRCLACMGVSPGGMTGYSPCLHDWRYCDIQSWETPVWFLQSCLDRPMVLAFVGILAFLQRPKGFQY